MSIELVRVNFKFYFTVVTRLKRPNCFLCSVDAVGHFFVEFWTGRIISLRVEVSLFVLSPEIENRDEVEVDNWAKHKKTFYSE
jgi:hypothetical protein